MAVNDGECARDGIPDDALAHQMEARVRAGAGLVLAPPVAVTAEARITPYDAGMYSPEQRESWAEIVERIRYQHRGTRFGVTLNHAGMQRVRDEFARAAEIAHQVGFDLLQLHAAHGYLLASFLSPLTNARDDEYGGSLANRMRFPLEVVTAVRAVWPSDRPLAVALTVTDGAAGGVTIDDGVTIARALKEQGCDLITVMAGQTTPAAIASYRRGFLTPLADRVRNEAAVTTLVGGYLLTSNEANTLLAAGRADLCQLEYPWPEETFTRSSPPSPPSAPASQNGRRPSRRSERQTKEEAQHGG